MFPHETTSNPYTLSGIDATALSDEEIDQILRDIHDAEDEAIADEAARHQFEWCEADVPPRVDPLRDIRARHHLFTEDELAERIRAAGNQRYLIADLFPMQSTALMVGDSNIGKSPLLYQLGICVAAGVPFFSHATTQGRVIYVDYENNIEESKTCARTIAEFLGLPGVPKDFFFWNAHDSAVGFSGIRSLLAMIRDIRPTLTIIDTLSKAFPDAEGENPDANKILNVLLGVIAESGGSILLSHHFKKNRKKHGRGKSGRGTESTPQEMANDARGASALISGVDLRLIVVPPPQVKTYEDYRGVEDTEYCIHADKSEMVDCAFEIIGFRRMGGNIPTIAVERVFQEGVPVEYRQIVSEARLRNPKYQRIFDALPDPFRPKDVETHFPNSGGSVQKFFAACHLAGIITKVELPVTPGFRHRVGYAKRRGPTPAGGGAHA